MAGHFHELFHDVKYRISDRYGTLPNANLSLGEENLVESLKKCNDTLVTSLSE
jgi:hypothetical protein